MNATERNRQVVEAYEAGATLDALARQHGISRIRARTIIIDAGFPMRRAGRPHGRVVVPAWVPAQLAAAYRTIAGRDGEEAAASLIRELKGKTPPAGKQRGRTA